MKKINVQGIDYFTNIEDLELILKCVNFFSNGCTSYAVSFENEKESIINESKANGMDVKYLRDFNFQKYFIPKRAAGLTDAKQILSKGLDLIELL